jgi:hypothetical protein
MASWQQDLSTMKAGLEQPAVVWFGDSDNAALFAASQALSLKRIADALKLLSLYQEDARQAQKDKVLARP